MPHRLLTSGTGTNRPPSLPSYLVCLLVFSGWCVIFPAGSHELSGVVSQCFAVIYQGIVAIANLLMYIPLLPRLEHYLVFVQLPHTCVPGLPVARKLACPPRLRAHLASPPPIGSERSEAFGMLCSRSQKAGAVVRRPARCSDADVLRPCRREGLIVRAGVALERRTLKAPSPWCGTRKKPRSQVHGHLHRAVELTREHEDSMHRGCL